VQTSLQPSAALSASYFAGLGILQLPTQHEDTARIRRMDGLTD
jgi:hypothetical protein